MSYFLGVDGGGTNTRVAIVNETGQLCGWGSSGPSNYDDVGVDGARANIAAAIQTAWQRSQLTPQPLRASFFGMAGVVSPTDRQVIRQIALDLGNMAPDTIGIDHDCRIALAGGLLGRPGIVLITGTGSSCYGRNSRGDDWRSGGWGQLISDEGSGYWFGLQAMRAMVRAYDRRDPPTLLLDAVMARFRLNDVNDVMHHLYVDGLSRSEIADLAPLVFDAAQRGDTTAQQLIKSGIAELVDCIAAVAATLELTDKPEVALTGGLHHADALFTQPLQRAIHQRLPGSRATAPQVSPVMGACLLALEAVDPGNKALHQALLQSERTMTGAAQVD